MYKNFDELCAAVFDLDMSDEGAVKEMQRLCKVYFDAQRNPPEGIIGVGAITYAEQMLIQTQQ
jgi:hypothetical protein